MNNYIKIRKIGEGSFGKVWLIKERTNQFQPSSPKVETQVMKEIDLSRLRVADKGKALAEVKVLANINHSCIVKYYDSFQDLAILCIIMEYCDGGDLQQKILQQKNRVNATYFDETLITNLFSQIAAAVKHMHDRKILHRDLKCENIFLSTGDRIKLGDFGVAKILTGTVDYASTLIGTPYYMSPEIWSNQKYNNKTDIWSLGCILYQMMSLKNPFESKSQRELILKVTGRGTVSELPNHFSYDLRLLAKQMLKKSPKDRPSINLIFAKSFIHTAASKFIPNEEMEEALSHTVLHGYNLNRAPVKPQTPKKKAIELSKPKFLTKSNKKNEVRTTSKSEAYSKFMKKQNEERKKMLSNEGKKKDVALQDRNRINKEREKGWKPIVADYRPANYGQNHREIVNNDRMNVISRERYSMYHDLLGDLRANRNQLSNVSQQAPFMHNYQRQKSDNQVQDEYIQRRNEALRNKINYEKVYSHDDYQRVSYRSPIAPHIETKSSESEYLRKLEECRIQNHRERKELLAKHKPSNFRYPYQKPKCSEQNDNIDDVLKKLNLNDKPLSEKQEDKEESKDKRQINKSNIPKDDNKWNKNKTKEKEWDMNGHNTEFRQLIDNQTGIITDTMNMKTVSSASSKKTDESEDDSLGLLQKLKKIKNENLEKINKKSNNGIRCKTANLSKTKTIKKEVKENVLDGLATGKFDMKHPTLLRTASVPNIIVELEENENEKTNGIKVEELSENLTEKPIIRIMSKKRKNSAHLIKNKSESENDDDNQKSTSNDDDDDDDDEYELITSQQISTVTSSTNDDDNDDEKLKRAELRHDISLRLTNPKIQKKRKQNLMNDIDDITLSTIAEGSSEYFTLPDDNPLENVETTEDDYFEDEYDDLPIIPSKSKVENLKKELCCRLGERRFRVIYNSMNELLNQDPIYTSNDGYYEKKKKMRKILEEAVGKDILDKLWDDMIKLITIKNILDVSSSKS
ncbi:hypothetical protein SNEBB_010716 [Seison nebaliae]|nr:hypothetical protein SNEBB_010716 [Seison nebaliae]